MLEISLDTPNEVRLTLTEKWTVDGAAGELAGLTEMIDDSIRRVEVGSRDLGQWDSALVSFLFHLDALCKERNAELVLDEIPEGAKRLLELATAVPVREEVRHQAEASPLETMGEKAMVIAGDFRELVRFVGDVSIAFVRLATFRARIPVKDLLTFIQRTGPDALLHRAPAPCPSACTHSSPYAKRRPTSNSVHQ